MIPTTAFGGGRQRRHEATSTLGRRRRRDRGCRSRSSSAEQQRRRQRRWEIRGAAGAEAGRHRQRRRRRRQPLSGGAWLRVNDAARRPAVAERRPREATARRSRRLEPVTSAPLRPRSATVEPNSDGVERCYARSADLCTPAQMRCGGEQPTHRQRRNIAPSTGRSPYRRPDVLTRCTAFRGDKQRRGSCAIVAPVPSKRGGGGAFAEEEVVVVVEETRREDDEERSSWW